MKRKESLRKMVDWIISELKEGKSIELDDDNDLVSRGYREKGISGFSIEDLESKN